MCVCVGGAGGGAKYVDTGDFTKQQDNSSKLTLKFVTNVTTHGSDNNLRSYTNIACRLLMGHRSTSIRLTQMNSLNGNKNHTKQRLFW